MQLLDRAPLDQDFFERQFLLAGALLMTACFCIGQNIDYRGVFFVLIMPGLVSLRRVSVDREIRLWLTQTIAAVLFVAWAAPLHAIIHLLVGTVFASDTAQRAELLFWVGRELVWWWLIAGLAAIVLGYAARIPGWSNRSLIRARSFAR